MKDYIQIGIEKGLISFNEDNSRIKYCYQGKERNYNNPEEKVQALAFLQLVIDYNYPGRQIKQFEGSGAEVRGWPTRHVNQKIIIARYMFSNKK